MKTFILLLTTLSLGQLAIARPQPRKIPVVTDIDNRAHHLFSVNLPKIVAVKKQNQDYVPSAVLEFSGRMEGNLCTHNAVGLSRQYIGAPFHEKYYQSNVVYSLRTFVYNGNKPIGSELDGCTSHSELAEFVMRTTFRGFNNKPTSRPMIWNIKFDMGAYSNVKKYSKTFQLVYIPKTDKWSIKQLSR